MRCGKVGKQPEVRAEGERDTCPRGEEETTAARHTYVRPEEHVACQGLVCRRRGACLPLPRTFVCAGRGEQLGGWGREGAEGGEGTGVG